jgi:hypothetical protein
MWNPIGNKRAICILLIGCLFLAWQIVCYFGLDECSLTRPYVRRALSAGARVLGHTLDACDDDCSFYEGNAAGLRLHMQGSPFSALRRPDASKYMYFFHH